MSPGAAGFVASEWVSKEQHTLRGFFNLQLPSGLKLVGCSLHEDGDKRWVGLPGRPVLDRDGRQLISPKKNKPCWSATVEIPDPDRRAKFREKALAAVDALRERGQ